MGKQLTNLPFEGWLSYVFDHPVEDQKQEWYWDIDRDGWDEAADKLCGHMGAAGSKGLEVRR